MSNPKWIVSLKTGDGYYSSQPGRTSQTMWQSRQATAEAAREEGAAVLGVAESRVEVTAWGELDWSNADPGAMVMMDKDGEFAADTGEKGESGKVI